MRYVLWSGTGRAPVPPSALSSSLSSSKSYEAVELPEASGAVSLWVDRSLDCPHELFWSDAQGWFFIRGWADVAVDLAFETYVIELWRAGGADALCVLDGALVVLSWRSRTQHVHVFRPALGMPPAMIVSSQDAHLFGTDPMVLCQCLGLSVRPNHDHALAAITRDVWSLSTQDALDGVTRVLPGHRVSCSPDGRLVSREMWSPEVSLINGMTSYQACDQLTIELDRWFASKDARRDRLCMSAGVDSSAMALRWCQLRPEKTLHVSSMVAPSMPTCDESEEIGWLEASAPIRSHHFDVSDHVPGTNRTIFDEQPGLGPVLHAGMTHERAFLASASSRDHVETLLGGFGADEALLCLPALVYRRALRGHTPSRVLWGAPGTRPAMFRQWLRYQVPETFNIRRTLLPRVIQSLAPRAVSTRPWHDLSRWLARDVSSSEVLLTEMGEPELWGHHRLLMTRSWGWEWFVRTTWRHMLALNTWVDSPWMSRSMWQATLRMPPEALMAPVPSGTRLMDKAPLRRLLERCDASLDLRYRTKVKSFDRVIESGLAEHFTQDTAMVQRAEDALTRQGILNERFGDVYAQFLMACQNAGSSPGDHVGSLSVWQTLAVGMWLDRFGG